jgi:hypothetical protein
MVVTYTGSFFLRQTPEPFLRGLRLFLERRPDARMEIRLVGGIQPPFAGLHSRMGLDEHVTAMGVVGFDQVPKLQADSHLLLTMVPPIPGAELKCSSKLAEYLRVGRPVMAVAPEGDMTRLVKRLKAGYTCPPKEGAVAECLARAYGDWLKGEMAGPARRTDVERLLDARVTMRGLAGFLSGLSSSGGGSSGGL